MFADHLATGRDELQLTGSRGKDALPLACSPPCELIEPPPPSSTFDGVPSGSGGQSPVGAEIPGGASAVIMARASPSAGPID